MEIKQFILNAYLILIFKYYLDINLANYAFSKKCDQHRKRAKASWPL